MTVPQLAAIIPGTENGATPQKFSSTGIILPPPDIKHIIIRTANHVARSAMPTSFEERIREKRREDPKFSFLNSADPYNAYYEQRKQMVLAGEDDGETGEPTAQQNEQQPVVPDAKPIDRGDPPPNLEYVLDLPPVTALELDTMKLTALFTAQRGRSFLATLSQKEGQNFEFDFLRPTSALFGLFNKLVEQYRLVLFPSKQTLEKVNELATQEGKWKKLSEIRRRAKWERLEREAEKRREDDLEAERKAFAEIDWQEFVVVQTIEFTTGDATTELPPPITVQQEEARILNEKRTTAMIQEDTVPITEAYRAANPQVEDQDEEMEQSDNEEDAETRAKGRREEEERAREEARLQAKNLEGAGPMKIRTDYVPKTLVDKRAEKVATTTCQLCGQTIPVNELDEHMRIELLDPKWKEQRDHLERRRAQGIALQQGSDVSASLKTLAKKRVDIFGAQGAEERRKVEEEEELARRKAREKVVWDGHTATKSGTMDRFQNNVNFDEQIAAIHRAKGLTQIEGEAVGPGIGPAAIPAPYSLPPPPAATAMPASMYTLAPGQPAPVVLPPLHYQGLAAPTPFGYAPPPQNMHPSRLAALNGAPPSVAGVTRTADEMLGGDESGDRMMKRARVERLPDGSLYPEDLWLSFHPDPITIQVKLPSYPAKPEWKLDGTTIAITDLPMSSLVSTLRDRIVNQVGSAVPLSKIRLHIGNSGGTLLSNGKILAFYNITDGEEIALELRDPKKK